MSRCLADAPEDRPRDVATFVEELARILVRFDEGAAPEGPRESVERHGAWELVARWLERFAAEGAGRSLRVGDLLAEASAGLARHPSAAREDVHILECNRATLLVPLERSTEAVQLFERAVEGLRRCFGERHMQTQLALNGLGMAGFRAGDHEGAIDVFRELLSRPDSAFGPTHQLTMTLRLNLGSALRRTGRVAACRVELGHVRGWVEGPECQDPGHPIALYLALEDARLARQGGDTSAALAAVEALATRASGEPTGGRFWREVRTELDELRGEVGS